MREKTRSLRLLACVVTVTALLVMGTVCAQLDSTPGTHQPIVEELKTLLGVKPDLAKALDEAIGNAGIVAVLSLDEYYALLDGSPYEDAFKGGIYTHSFLNVNDYHRYHVPVGGAVREVRNIHGKLYLDVIKKPASSLHPVDGDTYQFAQERGLVVIDSRVVGLVAIFPIGMAHVSIGQSDRRDRGHADQRRGVRRFLV